MCAAVGGGGGGSLQGLRLNLLLRLSPIVPYGFLNLAMGTTSTRLDDFTLGCIGTEPLPQAAGVQDGRAIKVVSLGC